MHEPGKSGWLVYVVEIAQFVIATLIFAVGVAGLSEVANERVWVSLALVAVGVFLLVAPFVLYRGR